MGACPPTSNADDLDGHLQKKIQDFKRCIFQYSFRKFMARFKKGSQPYRRYESLSVVRTKLQNQPSSSRKMKGLWDNITTYLTLSPGLWGPTNNSQARRFQYIPPWHLKTLPPLFMPSFMKWSLLNVWCPSTKS